MVLFSGNMSADGVLAGYNALSNPDSSLSNDPRVEFLWVKKAYQHAEIHFDLICSVDAKLLRLTPIDEEIYKHYKEQFPDFNLDDIDEEYLKSPEQRKIWREFCEKYKNKVEDYNFATLLRLNCDDKYTPDNTTIAPRIQFYAIEIARNKEGLNDEVRKKYRNEVAPVVSQENNFMPIN